MIEYRVVETLNGEAARGLYRSCYAGRAPTD